MRVLLVASPAHPTVARFTPTLATLAAQGCSIEACLPLSPELTREGIPHVALGDSELDAASLPHSPAPPHWALSPT